MKIFPQQFHSQYQMPVSFLCSLWNWVGVASINIYFISINTRTPSHTHPCDHYGAPWLILPTYKKRSFSSYNLRCLLADVGNQWPETAAGTEGTYKTAIPSANILLCIIHRWLTISSLLHQYGDGSSHILAEKAPCPCALPCLPQPSRFPLSEPHTQSCWGRSPGVAPMLLQDWSQNNHDSQETLTQLTHEPGNR